MKTLLCSLMVCMLGVALGGLCPAAHPYVYYHGNYCCTYNREKYYAPQGALCDGSIIDIHSLCCQSDKNAKCASPPCGDYEVTQCPASHPFAYYQGGYCCAHNREKHYSPQGERCDGSIINIHSLCCQDNAAVKCSSSPCQNNIAHDAPFSNIPVSDQQREIPTSDAPMLEKDAPTSDTPMLDQRNMNYDRRMTYEFQAPASDNYPRRMYPRRFSDVFKAYPNKK